MAILSIRSILHRNHAPVTVRSTQTMPKAEDADAIFLASLAGLPAEEREARIQRREWYKALAERQGIAEVEWQANRTEQFQSQSLRDWR